MAKCFTSFNISLVVLLLLIASAHCIRSSTGLDGLSSINRKLFIKLHDATTDQSNKYAVIFDAGSSGSRVHVFQFDSNLNLQPIGSDFELYLAMKPGLSSYENDPEAAAQSLKPMLDQAVAVVPPELRSQTPVRLGATAGLRLLNGDASEKILQAVRELLKSESGLKYKAEWVSILDGFQEGSYMWVAINYLLRTLGQKYTKSVGVVDLGGGSVQMAYAISEETAANAPKSTSQEDEYVQERNLNGTNYYLYAHSYLNYGLNAARAQILNLTGSQGNPCVIDGYRGTYSYSGKDYNVSAPRSGTSISRCRALTRKILNLDADCAHKNCSFNGAWNGGGGVGQKNLYIASFFYDTAAWADIVEQTATSAIIRPNVYFNAAKIACSTNVENIKSKYTHLEDRNLPFLCMDLVYLYSLLVDGLGISPLRKVTVVTQIEYKGILIGAAWPLGCAVDVISPSKSQLKNY